MMLALLLTGSGVKAWGQIAAWDFAGVTSTNPPATFAATTFNANLVFLCDITCKGLRTCDLCLHKWEFVISP